MASFLQYALSPFPRRRSRKSERDRASVASQDTGSTSSTPTPPSPAPKTRSVGIQTPVLQRRAFGPEDLPGTPTAFRRLKEKTRGWQASPLLSRRASQATLREGSATPSASRKVISPPTEVLHSPTPSRRNISPPTASSCASLSSHEPPPTPSSCTSYPCESPPTPSSTRRTPSHYSVDSSNAHVVHVGAAGLGLGALRGWEREVVLREACGRKTVVRESVRMSQCVVWECLPIPGPLRKRSHNKGQFWEVALGRKEKHGGYTYIFCM
ncbi:serine/arginine repetitive matrix protein 1-like [Penaeus japonicus]|uniref:serine/arginine repetitive matrix protein 1-like n=1 Tax=Penaeus japonicus TaxID=27405 RepID=UPI001C70F13A|nr:serine/arginine repetitive matrix protein 1-like [Penaeus japonicus]